MKDTVFTQFLKLLEEGLELRKRSETDAWVRGVHDQARQAALTDVIAALKFARRTMYPQTREATETRED